MIDILLFSLVVGFWCAGLHIAAQEGMILNKVAVFLDTRLGFWAKPLITCAPCMAGFHGILIFVMLCVTKFSDWNEVYFLIGIPPAIFVASLAAMVNKYFILVNHEREELIEQKAQFYE
jgi:hypothetical protein